MTTGSMVVGAENMRRVQYLIVLVLAQCVIGAKGIKTVSFSRRGAIAIISFSVAVDGFPMKFDFLINESAEQVSITSRPEWTMPRRLYGPTLEFITKLNYKLVFGHVDLDERDGEVRYKTSADFGNARNIESVLEHYMSLHLISGKQYIKILQAMKEDGISVRDALRRLNIDDYGPSNIPFDASGGGGGASGAERSAAQLLAILALRRTLEGLSESSSPREQTSDQDISSLLKELGLGPK